MSRCVMPKVLRWTGVRGERIAYGTVMCLHDEARHDEFGLCEGCDEEGHTAAMLHPFIPMIVGGTGHESVPEGRQVR